MYDEFLKLSENRTMSREGFLVIKDCPIARVGARTYVASEIPQVKPDGRESVEVVRTASELFADETVQSFEGKPVCLGHPEPFPVDPKNVSEFSVGHMQRVRPDPESGCLIADLFIEDQEAIASVTKGEMTQLSIGYVSFVKDVGGGVGLESRILGNHVAIVKEGRCGAMCSIKDSDSTKTEKQMGIFNNPKKDDDKDEAIKALTEENEALKKQLEELKASKQQDADQNDGDEPKEPQDPKEPKPLTIEDVQKCIDEAFKKRDEEAKQAKAKADEQKKNDEEVIKDAATVAPKLDSKTPDLAVKALEEFAQSGYGKVFMEPFGGVASIKKDEAPKYLKMAAASVRARAIEDTAANVKKDAKPETSKSWLEQAAALWK
ncbi:MAG TPA: DUF2213 domain-containing protein [Candidatus Aphodousia faecalis]|nr:DUF2213 domain-containing protein [Candidatus Aphodousia faecalis]